MTSPLVTINSYPAISFETLRNIANSVGVLNVKDAIEFLEESGVPEKNINQQEKTADMIYHVLKPLASSPKDEDRELLEKIIIQSINPALYEKSGITVQGLVPKYNAWLRLDNLQIVKSKDGNFILKAIDQELKKLNADSDKEMDEAFASNIKEPVLERISEIRYAYKLVMKIIDDYSTNSTSKETEINDFYIELFKILEKDIEYVHAHIGNYFGKADESAEYHDVIEEQTPMAGGYIQPYVYQDEHGKDILYKPFLNLYSAQSEMEKTGEDWDYVTKRMNACYGVLEDRFHRFGADSITKYPHKEDIDQIEKTLNTENETRDDINGSLTFYIKSGGIIFTAPSGDSYEAQLRPGSNGYLLLQYLISSGRVVPYMELAKHLNKQRENVDSDEERRVRDAIQSVRKALKLKNNDDLFITDYGFGLSCNSIIKRTE